MFKKTISLLEQIQRGMQLSIPVNEVLDADADGYFDRNCPADGCKESFKVEIGDWRELVPEDRAFCPVCGHSAPPDEWNTPEQVETIKQFGLRHISQQLGAAFREDGVAFNAAQPRRGLFQISMAFRPGKPVVVVPAAVSAIMLTRSTCESCGCRSVSTGAAFFCPACGHNSARSTFTQTISTVRKTMSLLATIVSALGAEISKDVARNLERDLVEHSLQRLVATFQRFAEATFDRLPSDHGITPRQNVFQNLKESSDIWEKAIGRRYEQMLNVDDFASMQRLFQQRHLLAHREGLVDQNYIDRSGDRSYVVGQRIVVRADQILELARLTEQLAAELAAQVQP